MATTLVSFHFWKIFVIIMMQLSISFGQMILPKASTNTCRIDYEEAAFEQRLLEKMRPAIVSLVSKMTEDLSNRINELTREMENAINKGVLSCPGRDWIVFENACYLFSGAKTTWLRSKQKCESFGVKSHLVAITSKKLDDFILANVQRLGGGFWTSGNDRNKERLWMWDSNKEYFRYENWKPPQPDDSGNEDCLHIFSALHRPAYWNDAGCNNAQRYICEFKP